jgi:UDPglucose--hexose-1-phosphate uridylyltransferase
VRPRPARGGELRRDPVSGLEVVVAGERRRRPGAFAPVTPRRSREHPDECPFCAGHEEETPPEVLQIPRDGSWQVRVVPNRYPALDGPAGEQEVVVHAPGHVIAFGELDGAQRRAVGEAWAARAAARRAAGWAYLFASLNDGAGSGASIDHSHSQLSAFSRLPPLTAKRHVRFHAAEGCPLCAELSSLPDGLLVEEQDGIVVYTPPASAAAYHLRAAPREHHPDGFADADRVLDGLGVIAARYDGALGPAPWNAWLETAPLQGDRRLHWHVEAFPRIVTQAGIELGAGLPICVVEPVEAARELRDGRR